jgi:hypothetical protein
MLDLPIRIWVGYRGLVFLDVVVITKIKEFFPNELSAIVGDDGIRDPKRKMMSWMKFTACLEPIFAKGLVSIHLVNLLITTSMWVKSLGSFLKGPRRSRTHTANCHVIGIVVTVPPQK